MRVRSVSVSVLLMMSLSACGTRTVTVPKTSFDQDDPAFALTVLGEYGLLSSDVTFSETFVTETSSAYIAPLLLLAVVSNAAAAQVPTTGSATLTGGAVIADQNVPNTTQGQDYVNNEFLAFGDMVAQLDFDASKIDATISGLIDASGAAIGGLITIDGDLYRAVNVTFDTTLGAVTGSIGTDAIVSALAAGSLYGDNVEGLQGFVSGVTADGLNFIANLVAVR